MGRTTGRIVRLAGQATGLVFGVALAVGTAQSMMPMSAQAAPEPYQPSQANVQPEPETYCQWSYEGRGTVTAYGNDIQAWRVNVRGIGAVKIGTVSEDALTPYGDRTWITVKFSGIAEDDIRRVSCRVNNEWHNAEPS